MNLLHSCVSLVVIVVNPIGIVIGSAGGCYSWLLFVVFCCACIKHFFVFVFVCLVGCCCVVCWLSVACQGN